MSNCVHHLEMSLIVPFRNVTVAGFGRRAGAKPVRSAAPDPTTAAQRHLLFLPRARMLARLVERLSRL